MAGGIGAVFGAPIGGVLFSLEVASYYFPAKTLFRSFFCALAAAYVARALNPFGDEHLIMLSNADERADWPTWHFVELIPFAVLGVCGVRSYDSLMPPSSLFRIITTTRACVCPQDPLGLVRRVGGVNESSGHPQHDTTRRGLSISP